MRVTKETTISEILQADPAAAETLARHGFHCLGCPMSMSESLERGAEAHGLGPEQVEELLKELNKHSGTGGKAAGGGKGKPAKAAEARH